MHGTLIPSHSTYAHFLVKSNLGLTPYDPVTKQPAFHYDYVNDDTFSLRSFSFTGSHKDADDDATRRGTWGNRIVSGRYSLRGDSHGAFERLTNPPSEDAIPKSLLPTVELLPHHDEIAVDVAKRPKAHVLYGREDYGYQYVTRYNLAVRHLTHVLEAHPHAGG